jgi:hypothetical protein
LAEGKREKRAETSQFKQEELARKASEKRRRSEKRHREEAGRKLCMNGGLSDAK